MYPSIILFVAFLIQLKELRSGCSVKVVVAEAGLVCSCLLSASVTSGSTAWKRKLMGISNFMVRIVGFSLNPCWFPHTLRQMFLHLLAALSWLGACLIHIAPGPQWMFSTQPCEWMQYR